MKKSFIEEMKEYLMNERDEILDSIKKNNEEYEDTLENTIPKDFADLASYSTDRAMLEFIGESNVKKLQKIDSALDRIHAGKYGKCIRCNAMIPEARLKALPYALKCIACQSKDEKKVRK
ncbi:TraR/DksA family transcriptional regulator [Treponema pedis]|uniref:C4 zinc finger n=2 Tax=Treponema pedis TaxID=409322 RepID=S5ZPV8_9SPIR|nr:TraR/DksA family transcriptional regulator [Treponema pedis]AGT44667.1 C4 zinc finger [Treponema pedis str. T A4]QOW59990.1 TraR/DksA family transcriptional regulator [Treponema pedis]QSI05329.1 TraR/DksA family transcriptional regulator [Treponema pedis]